MPSADRLQRHMRAGTADVEQHGQGRERLTFQSAERAC